MDGLDGFDRLEIMMGKWVRKGTKECITCGWNSRFQHGDLGLNAKRPFKVPSGALLGCGWDVVCCWTGSTRDSGASGGGCASCDHHHTLPQTMYDQRAADSPGTSNGDKST
jgi:hypothetical protein